MRLQVQFKTPGFSDMDIIIRAKGFIAVSVYWADENGPLPCWSSIAMIPIEPSGNAKYRFEGHRVIPVEATHVYAKCISPDFSTTDEAIVEILQAYRIAPENENLIGAFSVMSDLHLSGKTGRISRALSMAKYSVLIPGDLTNDGFAEQFDRFRCCIEENATDKLILSVTGNHDQLLKPEGTVAPYYDFQKYLFQRVDGLGYPVQEDPSGAYNVLVEEIDVIGLQCVTEGRKITFGTGAQLKWLERHLDEENNAKWHIILCHAPLLAHNPHRNDGASYFSKDGELQRIVNFHGNIIFISGHTHFSPNTKQGSVEYSRDTGTIYIDDGSVTPTELCGEALMPSDWKDGVITELMIYDSSVEIQFRSIHTGDLYPRGYYRLDNDVLYH